MSHVFVCVRFSQSDWVFAMPPKTKRLKTLQESARRAREGARDEDFTEQARAMPLLPPPIDAIVSDCSSDVSYDVRNESADLRLEEFVEQWVLSLSHEKYQFMSFRMT